MERHVLGTMPGPGFFLLLLTSPHRASDQSQLLGPRGRIPAHDLTRWHRTGKGVGPGNRSGGRGGVRREVGKMDGQLPEPKLGAVEGDARESRWWGVRAAGNRCARPDQRFRPSPLEH